MAKIKEITVSVSNNVNTGNYESLKYMASMTITIDEEVDNYLDRFTWGWNEVENQVRDHVIRVKKNLKTKYNNGNK